MERYILRTYVESLGEDPECVEVWMTSVDPFFGSLVLKPLPSHGRKDGGLGALGNIPAVLLVSVTLPHPPPSPSLHSSEEERTDRCGTWTLDEESVQEGSSSTMRHLVIVSPRPTTMERVGMFYRELAQ